MAEKRTREKHIDAITSEIKSLHGWLDYLERDITNDKGVIHAILINLINESCMKLVYNAGIANGAALSEYDSELAQGEKS